MPSQDRYTVKRNSRVENGGRARRKEDVEEETAGARRRAGLPQITHTAVLRHLPFGSTVRVYNIVGTSDIHAHDATL